MGLDIGINIKGKTELGKRFLNELFPTLKDEYSSDGDYEFGYWRKTWNIRRRFLDVFENKGYDEMGGYINLDIEDIPIIINSVLKYFLVESNWEYDGYTSHIFSWIEEIPSIAESMHDLYYFYEEVTNPNADFVGIWDKDFDIYFYDSY